ncbi:phage tail protein [Enterococcus sp. LJL51]|uniref:phage tail protein n=1 Tax=Enterococcus sp. LJL51 TaxID=3416656 RepID=UPI003CF52286
MDNLTTTLLVKDKRFNRSIKKAMKLMKKIDKQTAKVTKNFEKMLKPLSNTSKVSKGFSAISKQVEALNKAASASDFAGFQKALTEAGISFGALSTEGAAAQQIIQQLTQSYLLLSKVMSNELAIDSSAFAALNKESQLLVQSFINVNKAVTGLKNELAIDSSSIAELNQLGSRLTSEFSVMSQSLQSFGIALSVNAAAIESFKGTFTGSSAAINGSLGQMIQMSVQVGNALTEMAEQPQTPVEKTKNSFENLQSALTTFFDPISEASSLGDTFDGMKEKVSDLESAFGAFDLSNIKEHFTNFSNVAGPKLDTVCGYFDKFAETSKSATKKAGEVFNGFGQSFSNIPDKIISVFSAVDSGVGGFADDVARTIGNLAPRTVETMLGMRNGVNSALSGLGTGAGAAVDFFGNISEGLSNASQNVPLLAKAFGGIGNGIKQSTSVGATAMNTMVQGLTSVMGFALKALGPAAILGVALAGFGMLNSQFGEQINGMLTTAIEQGPGIITGFITGIISKLPDLMASGAQLVAKLAEAISVNLPVIIQGAVQLLQALVQGVMDNMDTLLQSGIMIVEALAMSLLEAAPQLLLTGLDLLLSLVNGIIENKDRIIEAVKNIITTFTENITNNLPEIIDKGIEILTKLAEGIISILPELIPVALNAITTFVNGLSENLPKLLDAAIEIVGKLCDGLIKNLPEILSAGVELILALVNAILTNLPKIVSAGGQIIMEIVSTLVKSVPDLMQAGRDLIQGLIDGIVGMAKNIWKEITNIGEGIMDMLTGFFGIHSPSRKMRDEIGKMLPEGIAVGIESRAYVADQAMEDLASRIMLPVLDTGEARIQALQEYSVQSNRKETSEAVKQPATFNIKLGNQQFQAFVSDISEAMGRDSEINLAF